MNAPRAILVLALSMVVVPGSSAAQTPGTRATTSAGTQGFRWSVTTFLGALRVEDGELDAVGMTIDSPTIPFGARIGYRFHPAWRVEGSYGYASLSATADSARVVGSRPLQNVDGTLHVYDLTLQYEALPWSRARVLLSAGAGGMRYEYDPFTRRNPEGERVRLVDGSWAHEFTLILGAGLEVEIGERTAFRLDGRDRIQFCNAEEEPINESRTFSHCPLDDAVLNNPELAAALSIRL